ncbi:MAG: putative colanic acid biosynthesis acetyltransferase [Verrucomicrobia bacterium]|nr:MAG: putative colanic acid biosynthesis acetyltransferase [Verrucomicrobiota bacterium]
MEQHQVVNPEQTDAHQSPWPFGDRVLRLLWEFSWTFFCVWTPKPLNEWRLFWLRAFGAKIDGSPFIHQRARISVPWNLTVHDRAMIGDRANINTLGEIEIGARAIVAQESYLSSGSHDFDHPAVPLTVAKITIGEDAFVGARTFVMPGIRIGNRALVGACSVVTRDIPDNVVAVGNPCRVSKTRSSSGGDPA